MKHGQPDSPCVLDPARAWLKHRAAQHHSTSTETSEADLRRLGAGTGLCFSRLSPDEWSELVNHLGGTVAQHPAAALKVLTQARLYRPRPPRPRGLSARTTDPPLPPEVNQAYAIRAILGTSPTERASLWHREIALLTTHGNVDALLNYPLTTDPSDRDIVLAFLAFRTRLSASETLAVRNGDLDPGGLVTLAALIDPELGPWTEHLTTSSGERSPLP